MSNPVAIFGLVMLLILLAPLLARRLRVPGIVGLILSGAIVGPSAMGLLERDATFELLGTVGLLYLMFIAGLSLEINQFIRLRNRSLTFGLASFFIPQTLGVLTGLFILDYSFLTSLLLGSIVGSHTLLAYPIAKRIGITRNKALTMAAGGTLVTDGLSLAVLAGVVAAASGDVGPSFWLQFLGLVGGYVALVVVGLPWLGRWFFRSVPADANAEYAFLLAVLFVTAYVSGMVGLAPIVGAFLAGLTLNRLVPENSPLMTRVTFVGDALFIPFFLLSVGMLVDFRVLFSSLEVWQVALWFTAIVIVGKIGSAKLIQRLFGHTPAEGWTIGGLTTPQAAATLAVTLVGFEQLELFDITAVNAVVVLILLSCLLGPYLVERYGRQVALAEETEPTRGGESPRRVLVPLANPESAEAMMNVAFLIREKNSGEPVYPITVALEGDNADARVAAGERMLGYAVVHAAAAEVPVVPVTRVDMNVAHGLLRAARDLRISTVVVGWNVTHAGIGRVYGSVVDQSLTEAPQQLLLCRFVHPLNTVQRILLAVPPFAEREVGFDEAVRTMKLLAQQLGAKLVVAAQPTALPRLEPRFEATRPELTISYLPTESVWHATRDVQPPLGENDLFVAVAARRGRISWQPSMERLPRQFTSEYNDVNLMVLYPTELTTDPALQGGSQQAAAGPGQMVTRSRVRLQDPSETLDDVVDALLEGEFGDRPDAIRGLKASLQPGGKHLPIEVAPGVVLLHAHSREVETPTLFLATLAEGLELERITQRAYVLFILLSPDDLPPKRHLESLASIAKLVHSPATVKRIYQAKTLDQLQDALASTD